MERAEAEAVYDAGREACVEFLLELSARHERQIARLEARVERLEERLRKSSSNSSKPPSAEASSSRPQRERSPGARKPGAQPGHEGTTRQLVADSEVAEVLEHWPARCAGCGHDLRPGEPAGGPHRHQVFELPPIAVAAVSYTHLTLPTKRIV